MTGLSQPYRIGWSRKERRQQRRLGGDASIGNLTPDRWGRCWEARIGERLVRGRTRLHVLVKLQRIVNGGAS